MTRIIESVASSRNRTTETHRVSELFPGELRDRASGLIQLLKDYYDQQNLPGQPSFAIATLPDNLDLDKVLDPTYLDHLQREVAIAMPRNTQVDRVRLYKNLRSYYTMRGSAESIALFFKMVLGDTAEVRFPRDQMLIPSNGTWDTAAVRTIYAEAPEAVISGDGTGATASVTVTGGAVTAVTPITTGTGYTSAAVTIVSSSGSGAVVLPILDPHGAITGYLVTAGGTGYAQPGTVLGTTAGSYTTSKGFVSDETKVQDSYFYQKFSYVIRTGSNVDTWKNAFQKMVHPAGFIFFGEILLLLESGNTLSQMPLLQPGLISDEDVPLLIVLVGSPALQVQSADTATKVFLIIPTGTSSSEMLKFYDQSYVEKYGAIQIQNAPADYMWGDHTIGDVTGSTIVYWEGIQLGVEWLLNTGGLLDSSGNTLIDSAGNTLGYSSL